MNVTASASAVPPLLEQLLIRYARGFPIRRGKLRVIDLLWSRAAGGRGAERMAALKYGSLKLPCDLGEMLQRQCYFFGTYFLAEDVLDCWQHLATRAAVIVDVGANVGIFSLAALAANRDAVVHAFEPTPELARGLRRTAAINHLDRLHVREAAVLEKSGRASLRRCRGERGTNGGMNFVVTSPAGAESTPIDAISLDDFCATEGIDRIDLLKIDVQGNEHQVLAGAAQLVRARRIGTVLFELNWATGPESPSPAAESVRMLEDAGYRFAAPAQHLQWRDSGAWMQRLDDALACSAAECLA